MLTLVRRNFLALLLSLPFLGLALSANAKGLDPRQVVQNTTTELLQDLKRNKEHYKIHPKEFYQAMDNILGSVVDADGVSRSVMTVRYSRQASPEQMARFQENFKQGLMQFYGNALLEYDNQDIKVLPMGMQRDPKRAEVKMEVTDSKGVVYPLSYTMVLKNNRWMMRNVVINGINVGKLFRDQFAEAMQKNGQDLDKVIDGWVKPVKSCSNYGNCRN